MAKTEHYIVDEPQRLDVFLSKKLDVTRSQITHLLKIECIDVDGKKYAKPGLKLKTDQKVSVTLPEPTVTKPQKIDFDVEIIYEDDYLMVINKPTGLTVHPAPSVKEPTLVDWLKKKGVRLSTISGEERHGIVHRLDKGTSGAMVIAKDNETHEFLSQQLQDKSMGRYYTAVIEMPLKEDLCIVETNIARSSTNRLKMANMEDYGKWAKTQFKKLLLSTDETFELLACKLFTGRTHQIRVHLESLNRHILGDHLYGFKSKKDKMDRILLHAYILYFVHPKTGEKVQFCAPIPEDINKFLNEHFNKEELDEALLSTTIDSRFNT